jgi:hypothetical protein
VEPQRFTCTIATGPRGRVYLPIPFDPDVAWGPKSTHHITGTINGHRIRGKIEAFGPDRGVPLGPTWRRDRAISPGDHVKVALNPEGPQRDNLAPDIAAALSSNPAAAAFFDSLATFYRTGYLKWINATKRHPDQRATRIAEMIDLLAAGIKERR